MKNSLATCVATIIVGLLQVLWIVVYYAVSAWIVVYAVKDIFNYNLAPHFWAVAALLLVLQSRPSFSVNVNMKG